MSMDNRTGRRFGRKPYEPSPFKAYEAAAAGETSYTDGTSDNEYNQAGREMLQPAPQGSKRPSSIFSEQSLARQGNTEESPPSYAVFAEPWGRRVELYRYF